MAKKKQKPEIRDVVAIPVTAKPFGRPTDYRPEYCEMLVDHMAKGLSFESFAGVVDSTFKTLYTWKEKHEDFLHAAERGSAKSKIFWESKGIDHIVNESYYDAENKISSSKSLNGTVWKFNMANRWGWADKVETKQQVKEVTEFKIGWGDEDQDGQPDPAAENATSAKDPESK